MKSIALALFLVVFPIPLRTAFADETWFGSGQEPERVFSNGEAEGEVDPIETDRHDFTQSARTVGAGVVQFEGGYSYFYKDENQEIENSHTTPELVARIGLTENLELRLRWNYAWQFRDGEEEDIDDLDSAEDIRYGLKLALTEQEAWLPESAVRIIGSAPTGGSDFTTDRSQFGMDVVYEWEFAEGWSLAGSSGFGTDGVGEFSLAGFAGNSLEGAEGEGGRDRFTAYAQSVALGMPLNERSELYLEYLGIFSDGLEEEFSLNFFNTGFDFLLTPDLVIDFRVGLGLNEQADDFFAGVGGAYRIR